MRHKKEETSNLENYHFRLPEAILLYILVLIFNLFPGISRACPGFKELVAAAGCKEAVSFIISSA